MIWTKAEKKRIGTKAQIRAWKERQRQISNGLLLIVILLAVVFSAYFGYTILESSPTETVIQPTTRFKPDIQNSRLRAAIVDHLSLTAPNEAFTETAAALLVKANYTVDYFGSEKVTVGFYKYLPKSGYSLIIFRVHSGIAPDNTTIFMFTSEPYSKTKYVTEQLSDQVHGVTYDIHANERPLFFAIEPKFISNCAEGRFNDTVMILMGCRGLETESMADALVSGGAKAFLGWDGPVSASHTDRTTTCLLQHLVTEKLPIEQALHHAMTEIGPDPDYKSDLGYYPADAGKETIDGLAT